MRTRSNDLLGTGLYSTQKSISVAGKELIPNDHRFYELQFIPDEDCNIQINNAITLPIIGKVGLETRRMDLEIFSLKIIESGINYAMAGKY